MTANAPQTASLPRAPQRPRRLDLQAIFSWLLADGIVEKDKVKLHFTQAQGILKNAVGSMHPLTAVAQCKLVSHQPPHRLLTLDVLSEWCAAKVGLPFIRIDPLKIDFTRVADVMSASYAARFNILPVDISATTLTVATADPFATEWEAEIAKVSRRRVERAQDLLRATNLTVTEVCHAVGYSSLGSFSSRFRALVGETPSQFQRRYADGAPRIPGCFIFMWGLAESSASQEKPDAAEAS